MCGGMSIDEICSYLEDAPSVQSQENILVFPVHVVWPMGFSWSSAVGQVCSVCCCVRAGIDESAILSMDHPARQNQQELAFGATDDVLLVHRSPERDRQASEMLERDMELAGISRNQNKDETLQSSILA